MKKTDSVYNVKVLFGNILLFTSIFIHLEIIYLRLTMQRHCFWLGITIVTRLNFGYFEVCLFREENKGTITVK